MSDDNDTARIPELEKRIEGLIERNREMETEIRDADYPDPRRIEPLEKMLEHERSKSSKAADRILELEGELAGRKKNQAWLRSKNETLEAQNQLLSEQLGSAQRQCSTEFGVVLKLENQLKAKNELLDSRIHALAQRIQDLENKGRDQ